MARQPDARAVQQRRSTRWLLLLPLVLSCPAGDGTIGGDEERSSHAGSDGPSIAGGVTARAHGP